MPLPLEDIEYLKTKKFSYDLRVFESEQFLIIFDYQIPTIYEPNVVELLIRIPNQYPMQALDMFYLRPAVKLKDQNRYPVNADQFDLPNLIENHLEYQRFSRHYQGFAWRPMIDHLPTHLNMIRRELEKGL